MKQTANKEMHEFWSGNGGDKWLRFHDTLENGLADFGKQAIATALVSSGDRVLDIGCGCGDTSFEIAGMIGESGHVHGVDISDLILEKAQNRERWNRNRNKSQTNFSFECADVQTHNFKSMIYDIAFSRFGVMFFNDPVKAFRNIQQSLQADGRIAFICWQPITENQWVSLPLEVVANHVLLPPSSDSEESGAFSFGVPNRIENILDTAGFVDISIINFQSQFNLGVDLDEAVTFLTHMGPASGVIEKLNYCDPVRYRIIDDLFETVESYVTDTGISLAAATWIVTAKNNI